MASQITDKAEVSIDFPDKFYMGSFSRGSRFDVTADKEGIHLHLERTDDEKRRVGVHIHYHLLADILAAIEESVGAVEDLDSGKRSEIRAAAKKLSKV